ncbi:Nucleobase-ascorbate transporter 4 [Glycine max]|nr:Nucleobase-ascorbate transporter 4 [Glycine max]
MEACSCGGEKQNMDEFEFELHRVKQQLPSVQYCVASSPSWPEGIRVGFLHCLVALGTNVMASSTLVPLMGGDNEEKAQVIETLLFVAAINTLPQTWFGTRLPVVMVASYTFLIPAVSVAVSKRMSVLQDPHQKFIHSMRAIQGALITASVFQISIGFFGFWRLFARCLGPFSVVPLMVDCAEIGLPAFLILVIVSQLVHTKKRSSITQSSCRTDRSGIRVPYPFQWGPPSFSAGDIFATVAASLVAIVESTGTFIAAWRLSKATPILPSVLGRGVGWLGIATLWMAFLAQEPNPLHHENAGLLGLKRIGSRRVIQISAGFMLFFSIIGKFGAFLASIPLSIVAAIYCVLFAFVVIGQCSSLVFLSASFNNIVQAIFSSPATVAIIDAYILDLTVSRGERSTRRDGGRHWWEKFRTFNQDIRTEDFFSLPLNFNRFFPSH